MVEGWAIAIERFAKGYIDRSIVVVYKEGVMEVGLGVEFDSSVVRPRGWEL